MKKRVLFLIVFVVILLLSLFTFKFVIQGRAIDNMIREEIKVQECSICGAGFFNACDFDECSIISKSCHFNKGVLGIGGCSKLPDLSSLEFSKVAEAKNILARGGFIPDYTGLYDFLEEEKGDKDKIFRICNEKEFDAIYCLKKASQQNPTLRKEICDSLELEMRDKYRDKLSKERLDKFTRGHKKECLLGIPQFSY